MRYVRWLVLNDGVSQNVTRDDIDAAEEAAAIDRCLIPLTESEVGHPFGKSSPYTVVGEVSGKYALTRLLDEGAPVADIATCLHSRAAVGLWRRLWPHGPDDESVITRYAERPGAIPWCAVRYYVPEQALPPQFDHWTKTIAYALVRREGW